MLLSLHAPEIAAGTRQPQQRCASARSVRPINRRLIACRIKSPWMSRAAASPVPRPATRIDPNVVLAFVALAQFMVFWTQRWSTSDFPGWPRVWRRRLGTGAPGWSGLGTRPSGLTDASAACELDTPRMTRSLPGFLDERQTFWSLVDDFIETWVCWRVPIRVREARGGCHV